METSDQYVKYEKLLHQKNNPFWCLYFYDDFEQVNTGWIFKF